jgi:iron complex outermembrane receptor protein
MKNTGVELTLNSTLVSKSKFSWNSSVNLSTNKNTVLSLSNDKFKLNQIPTAYLGGKGQTGNWSQVVKEGQPLGTFALWNYMGKNAAGTSTFKKADGTIIATQPLTSDFMVAGNAQPKFIYGWNNTFAYNNLDLSFFIRGVYGNKILNNTLAALNNPADSKFNNIPRFTSNEAFTDNVAYLTSDRFLEDGSYLRLDNLSLGYNLLNVSKSIRKIRLYTTLTNVLTITKYTGIDPELNIGGLTPGIDNRNYYPKTRTFLLGLSLNF